MINIVFPILYIFLLIFCFYIYLRKELNLKSSSILFSLKITFEKFLWFYFISFIFFYFFRDFNISLYIVPHLSIGNSSFLIMFFSFISINLYFINYQHNILYTLSFDDYPIVFFKWFFSVFFILILILLMFILINTQFFSFFTSLLIVGIIFYRLCNLYKINFEFKVNLLVAFHSMFFYLILRDLHFLNNISFINTLIIFFIFTIFSQPMIKFFIDQARIFQANINLIPIFQLKNKSIVFNKLTSSILEIENTAN